MSLEVCENGKLKVTASGKIQICGCIPPCPSPALECESWGASNTKAGPCGVPAYDGSGGYYMTEVRTITGSGSAERLNNCCRELQTLDFTQTKTYTQDEDGDCTFTTVCAGSDLFEREMFGSCAGAPNGTETKTYNADCSHSFSSTGAGATCPGGLGYAWVAGSLVIHSATSKSITSTLAWVGGPPPGPISGTRVEEWTLSNLWEEEDTADLITRTEADLEEAETGSDCSASRDLSEGETSYTIQKFRYRFKFTPPDDGRGYQIDWIERFTPEVGAPSDTPQTFIWDGTDPGVEQYTDWYDVAVPVTDGETNVAEIEVTCPLPE